MEYFVKCVEANIWSSIHTEIVNKNRCIVYSIHIQKIIIFVYIVSDRRQWLAIAILFGLLMIILILFVII